MPYYDADGNECSLDVLCRCARDPAWAASRIRAGELDGDKLLKIAEAFNAWANGDGPGSPSAYATLRAIGDILGPPWK